MMLNRTGCAHPLRAALRLRGGRRPRPAVASGVLALSLTQVSWRQPSLEAKLRGHDGRQGPLATGRIAGEAVPGWPAERPARLGGRSSRGQGKSELRSAAGRAAHADGASVRLDQPLDDVEAEPGAAAPLAPPELPKHA